MKSPLFTKEHSPLPVSLAMNKKKLSISVICFIGLFVVANSFLDPDFSWHMRHGLDILSGHFYFTDPYSYTMPSYPYVDHSWGMSVVFAALHTKLGLGYAGVAALCALLSTIAIYLVSQNALWIMPLIAASYLDNFQARAQVVSFLFLALLIILVKKYRDDYRKLFIFVSTLMCLWANLHGGFLLGIIYMWGYFVVDVLIFSNNTAVKHKLQLILLVVMVTLSTLITPYFLGTWKEALSTIINPLNKYVFEWQPSTRLTSFSLLPIIALFFSTLWPTKKVRWLEIFTILLFLNGLISTRVLPLFALSAGFVIVNGFNAFLGNKKIDQNRMSRVLVISTLCAIVLFLGESVINTRNRVVVGQFAYPTKAVTYIRNNPHEGNIFSLIHWNTYLLWKVPNTKVFMDGRMIPWRQNTVPGELTNAFETYILLSLQKEPLEPTLERFCVTRVLWTSPTSPSLWLKTIAPINLAEQLDKTQWKPVYEDEVATLYERPLPKTCKSS